MDGEGWWGVCVTPLRLTRSPLILYASTRISTDIGVSCNVMIDSGGTQMFTATKCRFEVRFAVRNGWRQREKYYAQTNQPNTTKNDQPHPPVRWRSIIIAFARTYGGVWEFSEPPRSECTRNICGKLTRNYFCHEICCFAFVNCVIARCCGKTLENTALCC